MDCHECAHAHVERPAVALCRYCSVGLCEEHLVEMHTPAAKLLFTCLHQPERGLETLMAGTRDSRPPTHHRAA